MRRILLLATLLASPAAAGTLQFDFVQDYHILERSQTLLTYTDLVVVGRTGNQGEAGGHVERYAPDSFKLQDSTAVNHEIRSMHIIDQCQLFVTGTQEYSTIDYCTSPPIVTTRTIPMNMVAHQGAPLGTTGFLFTEPNAGLYKVTRAGAPRRIGDHVSMTTAMQSHYGKIWIATYYNLWTVDPQSNSRKSLLAEDVYGEKQFLHFQHAQGEYMVASVEEEQALLFFDVDTGKLAVDLAVEGDPQKMTTYEECLVVAFGHEKRVDFIRFDDDMVPAVVGSWDVSGAGDRLKLPANIAIDGDSETLFLRSSYPCPLCSVTQSSLFAIREVPGETFNKCR